jgi:hypothetical protein
MPSLGLSLGLPHGRFPQGAAFAGALDSYTTNLAGAWSAERRLLTSYTGSLFRVRRSSDSTETNIGYQTDGTVDSAALLTFAGAGSAFVTTWYDQSGAGLNLTQATAANQPRIVSSGVLDTQNSHASMFWDGTNDNIRSAWSGTANYTAYVMAVLKAAGNFPMMVVLENGFQELRGNGTTGKFEVTDGGFVCTQAASSVDTWAQISWKRVSGTSTRGWMNNTAFAAAASGNTRVATEVTVGVRPGSALFANMYASELLVYSAAHDDTTREAIQTVQSSHYA